MRALYLLLNETFLELNFLEMYAQLTAILLTFVALTFVAMIVHWITKVITIKVIHRLVEKSKTDWDDYLLKHRVFQSLSHLASAMVFYYASNYSEIQEVTSFINTFTNIYFVIIFVKVVSGVTKAGNDIYQTTPYAATRSIKGYVQLIMIVVYFIATIFIIAFILKNRL